MGAREAKRLPYGNAKQTAKPKAERLFPFCIPVLMLFVADDHVRDQYGEHGDGEANQGSDDRNTNCFCRGNKHKHDQCAVILRPTVNEHGDFINYGEYSHKNNLQAFCFEIIQERFLYAEFFIGQFDFLIFNLLGVNQMIRNKEDNVHGPEDRSEIPMPRRDILVKDQR